MKNAKQKAIEKAYGEEWRDIVGYEGLYQISNLGRLKCCAKKWIRGFVDEKIYKQRITIYGYCQAILNKDKLSKTFFVHRIVALHFIPNPENKPQVNHKNGIKTDNRVENLEWNTRSENLKHAYRTGLKIQSGSKNPHSIKIVDRVTKIEYGSLVEAYKTTRYSYNYVSLMLNGKIENKTNLELI